MVYCLRMRKSQCLRRWYEQKANEERKLLMRKGEDDNRVENDRRHIEPISLTSPRIVANEAPECIEKDGWTRVKRKRAASQKTID